MSKIFQSIRVNSDTDAQLLYQAADRAVVSQAIHTYFLNNGYKLVDGNPGNGMYERGSKTMRLLFGAFVKYFKFGISLSDQGNGTYQAWFKRETSGMSGGLIGIQQVKNEFTRVCQGLQQF